MPRSSSRAAQAARWAARHRADAEAPKQKTVPRRADTSFAERELDARRSGETACDPWAPLARAAAISGGNPTSIRDEGTGRCYSYRETAARAARVGAWLRAQGLRPGGRVGILTPNCAAAIEAHYACAWAGCVALNLNARLSADEMARTGAGLGPMLPPRRASRGSILLDARRGAKSSSRPLNRPIASRAPTASS